MTQILYFLPAVGRRIKAWKGEKIISCVIVGLFTFRGSVPRPNKVVPYAHQSET